MNVIGHRDEGRIRGYVAWDREGRSEGVGRFRDGVVGHVCKTVIKYWSGGGRVRSAPADGRGSGSGGKRVVVKRDAPRRRFKSARVIAPIP